MSKALDRAPKTLHKRLKEMRKSIAFRLMLPAIAIMFVPPLLCFIFSQCATHYAHENAEKQLAELQERVVPVLERCFADEEASGARSESAGGFDESRPEPNDNGEAGFIDRADVDSPLLSFLRIAGDPASQTGGDARLMVITAEGNVIYPRDELLRKRDAGIARDFVQYAHAHEHDISNGKSINMAGSDGETYLANIYAIDSQSERLSYVITYCPTSSVIGWVDQASLIVFGISTVFALLILVVLFTIARNITKQLRHLRWGARHIGEGDFVSIEPEFSLAELEDMRRSMNELSQKLQTAEQTQRRFFQNVSHELRSPLMSIGGYAQGIEQGVFDPPQHAAHTIMEESERLSQLVDSLLCLSRLEGMEDERESTMSERMNVGDSVEHRIERMRGLADAHGVEIRMQLADGAMAIASEELFDKAMGNVLSNAIRYANTLVEAQCQADAESESVIVTVRDDGPGISEADMPHIFERCYKGEGGQFGLGLAIAKTAAGCMGATIEAANAPEGGALFTLRLLKAPEASN